MPIRTLLLELVHEQPATPIQVNNSTADVFANDMIKKKRSKAINMHLYWIHDRTSQGKFIVYWQPGSTNLGDYHSKHHSTSHCQLMRSTYLHPIENLAHCAIDILLQGCVNSRLSNPVRHGSSSHRSIPIPNYVCPSYVKHTNDSVFRPYLQLNGVIISC